MMGKTGIAGEMVRGPFEAEVLRGEVTIKGKEGET